MSDPHAHAAIGLPEAASRLGVSIRLLRRAIRDGRVAAPPHLTAVSALPADWLAGVKAKAAADPKTFSGAFPQKVPAFARYEGTSAWRKYRRRVREHARFHAAASR